MAFPRNVLGLAWRLAVYFAVLIGVDQVLSKATTVALHAFHIHFSHPGSLRPVEELVLGQVLLLIAAVAAGRLLAWIDGRSVDAMPLRRSALPHFCQGVLWGLGGFGATIGGIAYLGGYHIGAIALSGSAFTYYATLWVVAALVNGVAENLAILGYPFLRTSKVIGVVPAILLVGAMFAGAHLGNAGENPLGLVCVFLVGVFLATAIFLTGDLWLSIGIHAGAVFAEDFVFSVPDSGVAYTGHLVNSTLKGPAWLSGGSAGPEGSIVALPVFAVLLALLWFSYRNVRKVRTGDSEGAALDELETA